MSKHPLLHRFVLLATAVTVVAVLVVLSEPWWRPILLLCCTHAAAPTPSPEQEQRRLSSSSDSWNLEKFELQYQLATAQLRSQLETDYGASNVGAIFGESFYETSRSMYTISSESRKRIQDTMMWKMVQAHLGNYDSNDGVPRLVWATGGHSAVAGHGNFAHESFTVRMQTQLRPIFAAVGVEWETRPYGMGATGSGPEIASCIPEVFGADVDFLWWDYGMITRSFAQLEFYFARAARLATQPAMLMNRHNDAAMAAEFESKGFAIGAFNGKGFWNHISQTFPDSESVSSEELDKMPPLVRAMRCGKAQPEKGPDPCKKYKYTLDFVNKREPCNGRWGKAGWHPGWKFHAFQGDIHSLFLLDILDGAVRELKTEMAAAGGDPAVVLLKLEQERDALRDKYTSKGYEPTNPFKAVPSEMPLDHVYNGASYCHTARLPAQERYLGILTADGLHGTDTTPSSLSNAHPVKGNHSDLNSFFRGECEDTTTTAFTTAHNDYIPLVWMERQYDLDCKKYIVRYDHKDYFVAANEYGYSTLELPTDAELKAYGSSSSPVLHNNNQSIKGFFALQNSCGGWCSKGFIPFHSLNTSNMDMRINGVPVVDFHDTDVGFLARHENGHQFPLNDGGKLKVVMKITETGKFLLVSSFVVW